MIFAGFYDMTRLLPLLFLLTAALSNASNAASFDCAKAGTVQEKLICADRTLSSLDEKLAQSYQSAASESPKPEEIKKLQQQWLRNIRNKCTSKPCLVESYEKRIDELAVRQSNAANASPHCPITEQSLLGAWEHVSGGFFEEMSFEYSGSKREFNSWLHQRPEISQGTWQIENCMLYIRHPTEEAMSFSFAIVRYQGDQLYLREAGEEIEAVYKRIKQ